jgi:hypothetical protein
VDTVVRLHIVTREGEEFDYEVDPGSVGRLEFAVVGGDPELPARHWLHDVSEIRVSEHPQPVPQTPPPTRLVEREFDTSSWGSDGKGGRVRVGPRRVVKVHIPEPVPQPKPRAKAKR